MARERWENPGVEAFYVSLLGEMGVPGPVAARLSAGPWRLGEEGYWKLTERGLSPAELKVMLLQFVAGLSPGAVAEALAYSPSAVKGMTNHVREVAGALQIGAVEGNRNEMGVAWALVEGGILEDARRDGSAPKEALASRRGRGQAGIHSGSIESCGLNGTGVALSDQEALEDLVRAACETPQFPVALAAFLRRAFGGAVMKPGAPIAKKPQV